MKITHTNSFARALRCGIGGVSLAAMMSAVAWTGAAAQEVRYEIAADTIMVEMRDGTRLATDVYRPDAEGQFPTILQRTHYGRAGMLSGGSDTFDLVERGYVVVIQDTRGIYGSEGDWYLNMNEGWLKNRDTHDAIQWVSEQPWSNGKVGLTGRSLNGLTTLQAASTQLPALVTAVPIQSGSNLHESWFYRGGAYEHGFATPWAGVFARGLGSRFLEGDELAEVTARVTDPQIRASAAFEGRIPDYSEDMWHLPLTDFPAYADLSFMDFYRDWVTHPTYGPYWAAQDFSTQYDRVNVPLLHMGSWYDIFVEGTIDAYLGITERGATEAARSGQRLFLGPWAHHPIQEQQGALTFPGAAGFTEYSERWFDHWLQGADNGIEDEPPVLIYVMGDNEWRQENEWPLARTEYTNLYLNDASSETIASEFDGTASWDKPTDANSSASFDYDPADPVMTLGGNGLHVPAGPQDHQAADKRSLTYTSDVLTEELEITGHAKAIIYASSSAVDTDWVVRVSEVYPDGTSINIVDGILRARFRESMSHPTLIEPGEIYEYEITLSPTSNVFQPGNRIRVSITSSNFPRFSRNLNTAEFPEQGTEMVVATNTIYHDEIHPSHVILPVIPR